jgi:tRNA(adenine34) deaminase
MNNTLFYMKKALDLATQASLMNEVPVGAIIVDNITGDIISQAHNQTIINFDPCAHAEIIAIKQACSLLRSNYLVNHSIYVTMEPCAMCAYAISLAKISNLYFGCFDKKSGAIEHGPKIFLQKTTHYKTNIYGGFLQDECKTLLNTFFYNIRAHTKSKANKA